MTQVSLCIIAVILALPAEVLAAAVTCPRAPTDPKTSHTPTWESNAHGLASTGVLAVPFDPRTQLRDLVVANGNDAFQQPITIYRNLRFESGSGFVRKEPGWMSKRIEMYGRLAAGDIDRDGFIDLAATVFAEYPPLKNPDAPGYLYKPGGVDVYRGVPRCVGQPDEDCHRHPALGLTPAIQIRQGFGAASTSLGDVNGDGWLDLAVAVVYETPLFGGPQPGAPPPAGQIRVYMSKDGSLDLVNPWLSQERYSAGDAEFADMNQDGLLDLVVGTDRVLIFFGIRSGDQTTLETTPRWVSDELPLGALAVSLDSGSLVSPRPEGQGLVIAAASSCFIDNQKCPGRFAVYSPSKGTAPLWVSDFEGWAANVRLRDRDDDCRVDLVGSAWWDWDASRAATAPAPLRIYGATGAIDAPSLSAAPVWVSDDRYIGQAIALADLDCKRVVLRSETFTVAKAPQTLTLRDMGVERIHRAWTETSSGLAVDLDINWVVGERYVTITDVPDGTEVTVEYTRSPLFDIAVGTFEGDMGVRIYSSQATPPYGRCLAH